jgi:outer membrane biosynthesis protein TonB
MANKRVNRSLSLLGIAALVSLIIMTIIADSTWAAPSQSSLRQTIPTRTPSIPPSATPTDVPPTPTPTDMPSTPTAAPTSKPTKKPRPQESPTEAQGEATLEPTPQHLPETGTDRSPSVVLVSALAGVSLALVSAIMVRQHTRARHH